MADVTLLSEADLRACVALDTESLDAVEQAFRLLATAAVAMPPILRLDIPEHNGEVDVKTAYLPGLPRFAIKVSPGFFDNPKLGLPSLNGMMMLLSAHTGLLDALLLDNGYLTAVRTACAGAVAAKWLAREDARRVALLGAGEHRRHPHDGGHQPDTSPKPARMPSRAAAMSSALAIAACSSTLEIDGDDSVPCTRCTGWSSQSKNRRCTSSASHPP